MIFLRNIGDQVFLSNGDSTKQWILFIDLVQILATTFLTMAMAAVGLSINLSELRDMGYKPFVVGFISAVTVGIVCIISIHILNTYFNFFN